METKEVIVNFLKEHPKNRFSIKELEKKMQKYSYPTILKWVQVLKAEKKINVETHGNMKLIYYNGK